MRARGSARDPQDPRDPTAAAGVSPQLQLRAGAQPHEHSSAEVAGQAVTSDLLARPPAEAAVAASGVATSIQAPTALRWLHVPKTGSSFINVLARFACPSARWNTSFVMALDFDIWVRGRNLAGDSTPCLLLRPPWLAHAPVRTDEIRLSSGPAPARSLVALFRRPLQRLLSGFHHSEHGAEDTMIAPGMPPATRLAMQRACLGSPAKYVRWPSIAGCATKMVLGFPCASDRLQPTLADAQRAAARLDEHFAFVGLTERWASSICLFHHLKAPQLQLVDVEITLSHAGHARPRNSSGYNESSVEGFVDEADEFLYRSAEARFYNDLRRAPHCQDLG